MTPLNKNIRAGAKAIKGLAKYSYRADLTKPALARYALLKRSVYIEGVSPMALLLRGFRTAVGGRDSLVRNEEFFTHPVYLM